MRLKLVKSGDGVTRVRFDCTHALANQTVDLPEIEAGDSEVQ